MRLTLKHLILPAVFAAQSAFAANGVQAVQLDYVPLDGSLQCNRIVFTSSVRYKNTLFHMSRIEPGTGNDKDRAYNITRTKNGMYLLELDLFFPSNDEGLRKVKPGLTKLDSESCNWTQVKNSVNSTITEPSLRKTNTAHIPLTCLQVRIPGIAASASKGQCDSNDGEVDIVHYLGQSLRFNFLITEDEKKEFEANIQTERGIKAAVKIKFSATKRNGSITARVNFGTLVQDLQANGSLQGVQIIDVDQLSVVLRNTMSSKSISIVRESGTSEANNEELKLVEQSVLDSIMKEISLLPPAIPETQKIEKAKANGGLKPKVSVNAAMQYLQSKSNMEFTKEIVTAPETATALTEVKLQVDRLNDPDISIVTIRARDSDPIVGEALAGQTFTINPASWATDAGRYTKIKTYLTMSDLTLFNLHTEFPRLLNENLRVKDVYINGSSLAQGQWSPLANPYPYTSSPRIYRWKREQIKFEMYQKESGRIEATKEAFDKLHIFVSFSALGDGKKFTLNELIQDNPYWSGFYEPMTNRIFITAKKDLGKIRFGDKMNSKEEYDRTGRVITDRIIETRIGLWGAEEELPGYVILSESPGLTVIQKRVMLNVSRAKVMDLREYNDLRKIKTQDPDAPGMAPVIPVQNPVNP